LRVRRDPVLAVPVLEGVEGWFVPDTGGVGVVVSGVLLHGRVQLARERSRRLAMRIRIEIINYKLMK
jgi:hypothetical protein